MSKPPAKKTGKRPANPRKRGPSLTARLGRWLTLTIMTGAVLWSLLFFTLAPPMPDTSTLWEGRKSPGATFLAVDGTVIARRGAFNGALIPISKLPDHLSQAVIATEDRRFYSHFGMDVIGFARALASNIRAGGIVQGGSTLTQQLAKNLFLTPTRTITRKIQELMLAIWLEARLSKDEILTLYLNRVYLGAGTYGVEAASQKYFGKPARQVTLSEAALLAGLLKAPSRYAPTNNLKRSHTRAAQVLKNMVAAGYLTAAQLKAALRAPAKIARGSAAGGSRYFIDWIQERLPSLIGNLPADLIVRTTLDPPMQYAAEIAVERNLKRDAAHRKVSQAALVAFNLSGGVRAMVGGRSYAKSQYNRVTQAQRQPGSAFKPFVYLTALESGLSPRAVIRDEAVSVGKWRPRNFNKKYIGDVTLESALAKSLNTVAVKLSERVGRKKVIATARRLGLSSKLTTHPSLALGVSELNLMELSAAYTPLANGGLGVIPHGVLDVRTRDGRLLYRRIGSPGTRVVSPRQITQMNLMLSTALTSGTGHRARPQNRPAAGKTGTSQNFRDGWFIGYTADLIAGVWVGNDNNTPMRNVTGGQTPARIWRQFIEKASAKLPVRALTESPWVVRNDSRSRTNEPGVRKTSDVDTNDVVEQLSSLISKLFAVPGNSKSTGYAIKESEEAVEGE